MEKQIEEKKNRGREIRTRDENGKSKRRESEGASLRFANIRLFSYSLLGIMYNRNE